MENKNNMAYKIKNKKEKEPKFETRTYRVYTFENLPEESKKKALEKYRYWAVEDTNLAKEDDFLIDMGLKEKTLNVGSKEYGKGNTLFSWKSASYDLDRDNYVQYDDLKVNSDEAFRQELGVSKNTWKKVEYSFVNERERDTKIEFSDYAYEYDNKKELTAKEKEELKKAEEHFNILMEKSKKSLKADYEYRMSDEYLKEGFEANEYKFNENGEID